jgi:hypothetical protein
MHRLKSSCHTSDRKVVKPNRLPAQRVGERAVRVAIIRGHARRAGPGSDECLNVRLRQRERLKLQRRLTRRGQLDIDRGQQLGIGQSAMFAAQ